MLMTFIVAGCQGDMNLYTLISPPDTMKMIVSSENTTLDQDKKDSAAITFTWRDAANRGNGTELTYYFKMDIADNNFKTAITKMEIPSGVKSISFTHKEINNLLMGWGIIAGQSVRLSAEVIAEVSKSSVYMKPEISTVDFNVTGYYVQPRDLYIIGSAVNGSMDPAKALKMKEVISQQKYTWSGVLQQGDFKFIKSTTSLTPSYSQGVTSNTLVYTESTGSETLFHVDQVGFYVITLDLDALTIARDYPSATYKNMWIVGDATPVVWHIAAPIELKKDPNNQVAFIYEGPLYAGQLKFPLSNTSGFECDYLMPKNVGSDNLAPLTEGSVEYVAYGGLDKKWMVAQSEVGFYKVTLNTYDMTIAFAKQSDPTIPSDVPYKNVWITGSATPGGWVTPFYVNLRYDTSASKGTFVWEGYLMAGELKFPLSNTSGFECNYLMPTNVGSNNLASLSQTSVSFVANGNPDKKWTVAQGEEGLYKISLNVVNMTISFEKR